MSAYLLGILFGVALAIIACVAGIIRNKKYKKNQIHYDERQLMHRGKGASYGLYTMMILNLVYAVMFYSMTHEIVSPQVIIISISFIGMLVDVVYCVINNAYIMVGQNMKSWIWLSIVVIICNLYAAISNSNKINLASDSIDGFFLNVSICVVFTVILVAMLIRLLLDKRGDANEES